MRTALAARVNAPLGDGKGLIVPTSPLVALRKDASPSDYSDFYQLASTIMSIAGHAGLPQITVPAGDVDGCPVGLSILASSSLSSMFESDLSKADWRAARRADARQMLAAYLTGAKLLRNSRRVFRLVIVGGRCRRAHIRNRR